MLKGLDSNAIPRSYQPQVNYNSEDASNGQLPGYGQLVLEAQIQTDDEALRDRIKALYPSEVLVLRGDRDNSLASKGADLNETLMKQHLSCLIVKHHNFEGNNAVKSTYLNRYLAIYVLYNSNLNLYTVQDDVVKAFYI